MVGNCSSTLLCEIDLSEDTNGLSPSFITLAKRIALELAQNLQHSIVSGVDIMQELNRINGSTFSAVAPFIFTCPIGVEGSNSDVQKRDWIFDEIFFSEKVPHTACVNAVKEYRNGTVCASLDIIKGIFPSSVVDGFFNTYEEILHVLGSGNIVDWNKTSREILPPPKPLEPISPNKVFPAVCLHQGVLDNELVAPDSCAVVNFVADKKVTLSFRQLKRLSSGLAAELRKYGKLLLMYI